MGSLVSILGAPGAGKSTQINILKKSLDGANLFVSVPALIKQEKCLKRFISKNEMDLLSKYKEKILSTKKEGKLAPIEVDNILFSICLKLIDKYDFIIMDACPRGLLQSQLLWSLMSQEQRDEYEIFLLDFENEIFSNSYKRQKDRCLQKKVIITEEQITKMENKSNEFINNTMKGINFLEKKGKFVHKINCTYNTEKINASIIKILNYKR